MPSLSTADHLTSPPSVNVPREYNAAHDLIERNLAAGRAAKVAYIDDAGSCTYGELAERVNRAANALVDIGLHMEERVLLCHLDTIDWPSVFLGAIKAGIVPIAVNTLLTRADYEFMLRDSRARALVVSDALYPTFAPLVGKLPHLKHVIVSGKDAQGQPSLQQLMAKAGTAFEAAQTTRDDACFWLYSSGSTGTPKGTVHTHASPIHTAELYAKPVLGIRESDRVFSAAKLFFAYGLGNALTFPLAVGATTVLMAERPTPQSVFKRLKEQRPTILRRADAVRGAACEPGPAEEERGRDSRVRLGGRGAAGGYRRALDAAFRRRNPGRHRIDRDAAHLPFQPARGSALRHDRQARAGLPDQARRRRRNGSRSRPDRRASDQRTDLGRLLLEQSREEPGDLRRRMDAGRGQVQRRQGRLLHVCGSIRRHAQGERHLRIAVRSGSRARPTPLSWKRRWWGSPTKSS